MSLYVPEHFAARDRAATARLLHDHPFATLITPGDPEPYVSHLPLLFMATVEPEGMLIGHFARANPHWRQASAVPSLAIFVGPHAYVSPSWYETPERMVPTWNYAAVHAHGTLEIMPDPEDARGVLDALIARFEGDRDAPWQLTMPAPQRDAMIGAIVAFRMPITRLDVKLKLSQNRSAIDRARVATALDAEGYAEARATAEWMRRYADTGPAADETR